jgi:hypothetical protein
VNALAVLPDGRVASGADDRIIKLGDPASGEPGSGQLICVADGAITALAVIPSALLPGALPPGASLPGALLPWWGSPEASLLVAEEIQWALARDGACGTKGNPPGRMTASARLALARISSGVAPRNALPPGSTLLSGNLPAALREELEPALRSLMNHCQPQGLWLYSCGEASGSGSWARGTATRRSDVDLLVLVLEDLSILQAYDRVLEAMQSCSLPVQPVVVRSATLLRHGDSPFWLDVKRAAIPLLEHCRFP